MHLQETRTSLTMPGKKEEKEFCDFPSALERIVQVLDEFAGKVTEAGYERTSFAAEFQGCGNTFNWLAKGDERELSILYLLLANFNVLVGQELLPEAQVIWRRFRYSTSSPERLWGFWRREQRRYQGRWDILTRALLKALNIQHDSQFYQYSAQQIAEAWCLSEACHVPFDKALTA